MQKNSGIFRLLSVFLISIIIIGYNVCNAVRTANNASQDVFASLPQNSDVNESEAQTSENPQDNKNKTESSVSADSSSNTEKTDSSNASSAPAAAKGTVKGKIISSYISPYNASVSYGKVYVKNSSGLNIDIKSMLNEKLYFNTGKSSEPLVLIMHTHTTETYMTENTDYYTSAFTSRTRDTSKNMVSVGEIVAKKLNAAGIKTLHDKTEHDYPQYTGSYTRAAATINSYLKKHPGIKVVLDLHRDAIGGDDGSKTKLVTTVNGRKAAQVMLVMGSQSGTVTNFPNWRENFKLAVRVQQQLETDYPTLARPISLTSKNYNESLTKGSLLIEFGTDANTVEEAHYSAELVGNALAKVLGK